jgi:hypothetical protein
MLVFLFTWFLTNSFYYSKQLKYVPKFIDFVQFGKLVNVLLLNYRDYNILKNIIYKQKNILKNID